MSMWISLLNGTVVSVFGCLLSGYFCGVMEEKSHRRIFLMGVAGVMLLQAVTYSIWNEEIVRHIYPLVIHLPLMILLGRITGKPMWSIISVLFSYLCCQLRRWLALLAVAILNGGHMMQDIAELILTLPLIFVLIRYVAPAVQPLSEHTPRRSVSLWHYSRGVLCF